MLSLPLALCVSYSLSRCSSFFRYSLNVSLFSELFACKKRAKSKNVTGLPYYRDFCGIDHTQWKNELLSIRFNKAIRGASFLSFPIRTIKTSKFISSVKLTFRTLVFCHNDKSLFKSRKFIEQRKSLYTNEPFSYVHFVAESSSMISYTVDANVFIFVSDMLEHSKPNEKELIKTIFIVRSKITC